MTYTTECPACGKTRAITIARCPHCGHAVFPNVAMAEDAKERQALDRRYDKALRAAAKRGAEREVQDFETATAGSVAVIARSLRETERLADGDHEGYATYYGVVEAGVRYPKGEKWDPLREVADAALFGPYRSEIRFGALSLDGKALASYGEIAWVLRDNMIADRTSVFEENSVMFMKHHKILMSKAHKLPRGRRATWHERSKLCVAKLAEKIKSGTEADEFPEILMRQGRNSKDDDFVETHIGGSITVRTLERVIVMAAKKKRRKAIVQALEAQLAILGVVLET